jgi:hypothetical protein
MDASKHIDFKPMELWESQPQYQEFELSTFRDHVYQEEQTRKYLLTLQARQKEKEKKVKEKAKKLGMKVQQALKRKKHH